MLQLKLGKIYPLDLLFVVPCVLQFFSRRTNVASSLTPLRECNHPVGH
jgi:hypothetical protein